MLSLLFLLLILLLLILLLQGLVCTHGVPVCISAYVLINCMCVGVCVYNAYDAVKDTHTHPDDVRETGSLHTSIPELRGTTLCIKHTVVNITYNLLNKYSGTLSYHVLYSFFFAVAVMEINKRKTYNMKHLYY